jgi:hypothetical protein
VGADASCRKRSRPLDPVHGLAHRGVCAGTEAQTSPFAMMRPASYIAAARRLRQYADKIERRAGARSAREKQALTRAIHGVAYFAQEFASRHRRG